MQIFSQLLSLTQLIGTIALTIGNFDGVHLGHQLILETLNSVADHTIVITYNNHPREILGQQTIPLIYTNEHKMRLLEQYGVDIVFSLDFTKEFSQQSAEEFLSSLKQLIPFNFIILGDDARIGKKQSGTPEAIDIVAKTLNFNYQYITRLRHNDNIISSTTIRQLISEGNIDQASSLLGRRYSIQGNVIHGAHRGKELGFPTANIDVSKLCLPPLGVYEVTLIDGDQQYHAIANLGRAPTIYNDKAACLEVHIPNTNVDLYDHNVEVVFHRFIRPEKRFSSLEELKQQINLDISSI